MEKTNEQTDSSSSEDEIKRNMLKEVVDQQFLSNELFNARKDKVTPQFEDRKINKLSVTSLRSSLKQKDKFTNFGVTSGFQDFIAKKLNQFLERTIKESEDAKDTDNSMKQQHMQMRNKNSGIKLLNSSTNFLTLEEYTSYKKKSKKHKKNREITEDDNAMSKFQEVAIDPEYILSKLETKAWTNKYPQREIKYKRLKNGILVEQR